MREIQRETERERETGMKVQQLVAGEVTMKFFTCLNTPVKLQLDKSS